MSDQLSADIASLKIDHQAKRPAPGRLRLLLGLVILVGLMVTSYLIGVPLLKAKIFKTEVTLTEIVMLSPVQEAVELTATGYVVPQLVTKITPKIQGRIAQLHVKEGQEVQTGHMLFQLEDSDLRARIMAARQRVIAARASTATARANLTEIRQQAVRQRTLMEKGVTAKAVVEDLAAREQALEAAAQAAEAQIKVTQAELSMEQVNQGYVTVRAPINGVIINKPPPVGELVGPGLSSVIELADFQTLVVETDVPEGRLSLVRRGGPCEIILDAFPTVRHRGEVVELGRRVNRAKATVVVKIKFLDPAPGILPDMAARVNFLSKAMGVSEMKEPPKVVVPAAAVARRTETTVVFTVEEGRARMRPVVLGEPLSNGYVLQNGPPAGTRVVREPAEDLVDGLAIKERTE